MKIIDLLNKIANGKEVPKEIKYNNIDYFWCGQCKIYERVENDSKDLYDDLDNLNDQVEILEEKKIPEKLEMALLGQQNNWTQKFNKKTKAMETTDIELNPYIIEIITTNTLEIQNTLNQLIDYLKSKGE